MDLFPLNTILKNLYIPITITIVNGYDCIKKWLLKNISTTAKAAQTYMPTSKGHCETLYLEYTFFTKNPRKNDITTDPQNPKSL